MRVDSTVDWEDSLIFFSATLWKNLLTEGTTREGPKASMIMRSEVDDVGIMRNWKWRK